MFGRLLGTETEYAIRFTPAPGLDRPRNDVIYDCVAESVQDLVRTLPGGAALGSRKRLFLENGGCLYYEAIPYDQSGGLVECGTPECTSPAELLVYQRAFDELLIRATPGAEQRLAEKGHTGTLALLKNCRDGEDHVYGAQENYEVDVAQGLALAGFRLGVLVLLPLVALTTVVMILGAFGFIVAMIIWMIGGAILLAFFPKLEGRRGFATLTRVLNEDNRETGRTEDDIGRILTWMLVVVSGPAVFSFGALVDGLAFRRTRRALTAFLMSRPIFTGAGTLDAEGRFGLSEKAPFIGAVIRYGMLPEPRPLYDTGNLIKGLLAPLQGRLAPLAALFHRRQRLQLGLSDSNMADAAVYLKVGTTALVIEMAEAGWLANAPRLRAPLQALSAIVADPSLEATVELVDGSRRSALEIQRWYLERAREFLRAHNAPPLEASEILRLWQEALDALERDPGELLGRIDWVTKRYLLDAVDADSPWPVLEKIDLKYHELATGYFARLDRTGIVPHLATAEETEAAITQAPGNSPAHLRGRWIRELADRDLRVRVDWSSIRVGRPLRAKVIRLTSARSRRSTL